jgi:hypothetical protein
MLKRSEPRSLKLTRNIPASTADIRGGTSWHPPENRSTVTASWFMVASQVAPGGDGSQPTMEKALTEIKGSIVKDGKLVRDWDYINGKNQTLFQKCHDHSFFPRLT